jgi:hypothetical protein
VNRNTDDNEIDTQWLREHVSILEACAERGFVQHGRGSVIADRLGKLDPFYMPAAHIPSWDKQTRGIVQKYSPATEAVVVLLKQDKPSSLYLLINGVKPADQENVCLTEATASA